ncbi:DUF4278 domain-containing protein [Trichothermofontia sp.]
MQLTYRGTTYTQAPTAVATARKTIGQYRGATCEITTTTLNPVSRKVQMIYRGVAYLGTTSHAPAPSAAGVELPMTTAWAMV